MAELMLVNPKRKRSRRRKMTAKQLKYFGPRRKRSRRRVAAAATPRRRHRRRSAVVAAPRRRRSHKRRRVTHLRRNPIRMPGGFSPKRFLSDTLIPAGIGAGGALGVDIALGYFGSYLPASMQTGLPNAAVKLAAAVGIGIAAGAVAGKRVGEQAMAGAVVVTLYSVIKQQVMAAMPTLPLHGYNMGWVSPALQVGHDLSAYVGSDNAYAGGMHGVGVYVGEAESDYYR
jgi:hypothetical protein